MLVAMLIADKRLALFYFDDILGSTIFCFLFQVQRKSGEEFVTEIIFYLVILKLMAGLVLSGQLPLKAAVLQKFSN